MPFLAGLLLRSMTYTAVRQNISFPRQAKICLHHSAPCLAVSRKYHGAFSCRFTVNLKIHQYQPLRGEWRPEVLTRVLAVKYCRTAACLSFYLVLNTGVLLRDLHFPLLATHVLTSACLQPLAMQLNIPTLFPALHCKQEPLHLLVLPVRLSRTHMWARPAFLTAEEMAFMAVSMELSSCVSSPVAPLTRRPFSMTNRVRVSISVSKGVFSDIFAGYQCPYALGWVGRFLAVLRCRAAVLF